MRESIFGFVGAFFEGFFFVNVFLQYIIYTCVHSGSSRVRNMLSPKHIRDDREKLLCFLCSSTASGLPRFPPVFM